MNLQSELTFKSSAEYDIHRFGAKYSEKHRKQVYFQQVVHKDNPDSQSSIQLLLQQNQHLKQQIVAIKDVLGGLLYSQDQMRQQSYLCKRAVDLIQELLQLILAKSQENTQLKLQLGNFRKIQTPHQTQSIQNSDRTDNSTNPHTKHQLSTQLKFNSAGNDQVNTQEQTLRRNALLHNTVIHDTRSRYHPNVLSTLGKSVKTINQINTNQFISKKTGYQRSSEEIHQSFVLPKAKARRLSIDKTIYARHTIGEDNNFILIPDCTTKSTENAPQDYVQRETVKNRRSKKVLTCISQQKPCQIEISTIGGLSKLPKRDRGTLQSISDCQ